MFTPADIRSPLLLIKSKKLSEQPGMVLLGSPPRWHKLNPGDEVPKDVHHALHKKGEIAAATKLSKDPEFQKLSPEEQVAKVQAHAKEVQDKNTASSKVATWKKKILSGQAPQPLEWKSFFALPRDKQNALFAELKADPETAAKLDEAMAKFRMEAVKNIQEKAAEPEKTVEPEKVEPVKKPDEEPKPEPVKAENPEPAKADPTEKPTKAGEADKPEANDSPSQSAAALVEEYEKANFSPEKKEAIRKKVSGLSADVQVEFVKRLNQKSKGKLYEYEPKAPDDAAKESHASLMQWFKDRAKSLGLSEKQYSATHEFGFMVEPILSALFKPVQEAYDRKHTKFASEKMKELKDAGLKVGDTVERYLSGAFLQTQKYSGTIAVKKGVPVVKLDMDMPVAGKGGKVQYLKTVSWDSTWKLPGQLSDQEQYIADLLDGKGDHYEVMAAKKHASKEYWDTWSTPWRIAGIKDLAKKLKDAGANQDKAQEADKKPDIEADKKPADPDEYEAKIQEYATGATYKQKAYKILSKDPDWQKLSAKDKFEELHNWYLMEQEKASLSGAMAKFKAALLSGKAPTKALVEKFNGLSKDDQAKVLKPVFEQKDKAEIGKLLEQAGAGNAPKAESQKASETDSPKDGDTKQGADGLLVFKNGRWHKQGEPEKAEQPKAKLDKKLTAKAAEALAYELGKKAHAAGHSAPATDDDLLKLLGQLSDAGVSTSAAQKAWYKGKTDAMLAAPVPGWTDSENQELAQAMGGESPAEAQTGKGTAWVTALAAGKKPDADIDNAIVTMPEERQQELFTKAAASWAKTQELDADENGVALGKLVLSDVMNDREHHEGDIKTINGVSYILQNGRWHRVQKSTDYGPQQKLEAMQALGSSDLMDEIDSGKISAKTDKLLDVMGPEAKASFYNWVATYKDYGFTVYRKAAVCAAYGHPNEVLLKDGTWVPFDPAMTTTSLAVPSDIHLQAVKEATLAAQNEPSTGPENPDTPQSFGHGTVTFVGPSKLHDLLAGKGWNVSDGPNFKHTFLKNMLDWSISQSKDDYNDWKQSMFYLHDMFPVGATVKFDDSGKATWKVIQGEKGVTFKNVLTGEIQNYKNKEDVAQLMGVLWNVNPTVIPPGHPAGKTIRDPVSDTVKVDSPEINVNGISYKKVDDVWQFKNSHGDWVAPQFSEEAISTLESKLAEMASGQPQGTVKIDGYPNVNFKKVDGEWKVVLEDGGLYPAGPVATGMLEKQYGAKSSDSSIITMDLPFVGETNYKKINGVWMTEDQKGNPDAGWHAINQDGGIVKDLEDKLKASQGDSYDVMQHPAVKDYIEMLSHSVNPTSGQTISLNSAIGDNGTKAHDEVIKQAAKEYAKLHNLKDNDPDDQALALDIVSALAYGDQGPQEGDTKTKNGHTYQLINGRWHRVDKDQDTVTLPGHHGAKFKNIDGVWKAVMDDKLYNVNETTKNQLNEKYGSGSPGLSEVDKGQGEDTVKKPAETVSPLDAIKPPHQAIDDSNLSPIQKEKLKEQLENLKTAAQQDGISAFKGVVKHMTKSGKTHVKIPNVYKIIVHDNKDWNKPWSNELLQYIQDLKAATELASGKKPKKAATKKTSTASAPSKPVSLASKTEAIDDWKQVGGQGGYNPGGTYQDANGEEWYCKFPEGGDAVVKNELLAVQLYKAAGLTVPDVKLVSKNGKIGLGSKILKGAVEDKEWLKNGGGPGVMEGFAIDAWLANWDTVGNNPAAGKGFDNILKMPDGSAARIDAGGAMLYGGAGSLKGDKFGDVVTEMETLRDASKNPNTAKVFGQMTAADIKASVEKLALLSDVKIGTAVMLNGPGSIHDRIALFKKLLARKASILSKFPDLRPKAKEAVFDPDKIHTPPNFLNWGESGKSGPATLHDKNVANQEGVNKLFEVAKQTGDIEAIKAVQFPFIDKDGKVTHYVSALDHPSQWVSGYATQMVNEINNQMSPEQLSSLEFEDGAHPLSVLSAMFPAVDPGTFTDKIGNYCNLGYVGTFDKQDLGLPPDKTYKSGALTESTYAEAAKDAWKKMPAYQQQAVQSYTGSGYGSMNGGLWKGNPSGSAKAAKEALQTLSHPIESGTVLSRRIALHGEELDKLVGGNGKPSSEGKILMEPAIQSTSINPGVWTGGKNVSYRMTVGPGVKGLYVGYGSKPGGGAISVNASEQEILLPPDTKMLVQKITKTTTGTPDGFGGHGAQYVIEVVILPN